MMYFKCEQGNSGLSNSAVNMDYNFMLENKIVDVRKPDNYFELLNSMAENCWMLTNDRL